MIFKSFIEKKCHEKKLKNKNRQESEPSALGEDIPAQNLLVDPLRDDALDEAQPEENPGGSAHTDTSKKVDQGIQPWPSVSWP